MEKIILIITFALLLTSCQEQECPRKCNESCFQMTLSNALPVQFWLNGQESYNTKVVDGVEQVCFCQPFQCDDEINLQFTTDVLTLPPLSSWTTGDTSGTLVNWTTGPNPSVSVSASGNTTSERLTTDYAFIPGEVYTITIRYSMVASSLSRFYVRIYDDSFVQQFSNNLSSGSSGDKELSLTFTATSDCTKISVVGQALLLGETTFTVTEGFISNSSYELAALDTDGNELGRLPFEESLLGDKYLYSISFIPNDFGACDRQIKFHIIDNNTSPGIIAESDCISIRETHTCTKLITYSNNSDFAGLVYDTDSSPDLSFNLRIPAIFFEEELPTEQQDTELSNGEIVRLYNKLELKRRLDVGFMPQYMHQKLQLVLMHDNIEIDEKQWIRRDAYEKKEGNRSYPLRRASVFLHDKDFIKENQL